MAEKISKLSKRSWKGMLKLWSTLISFILALPFLSSCSVNPNGGGGIINEVKAMYGAPSVNFTIKGTVNSSLDATQVIEGIEVDLKDSKGISIKKTTTDKDGAYTIPIYEYSIPSLPTTVKITFKDIDGEKNGLFQTSEQTVTVTEDEMNLNNQTKKIDADLTPFE